MLVENDDGIQHMRVWSEHTHNFAGVSDFRLVALALVALALLLVPPFINTGVKLLEFGDQRDS
jgi:hypothetical protein